MTTVTRKGFAVSITTGTGITGAILNITRTCGNRYIPCELNGTVYASSDDADAAALARGYSHPYLSTRNGTFNGFVATRASRKRGIIGNPAAYNLRQRQSADRRAVLARLAAAGRSAY